MQPEYFFWPMRIARRRLRIDGGLLRRLGRASCRRTTLVDRRSDNRAGSSVPLLRQAAALEAHIVARRASGRGRIGGGRPRSIRRPLASIDGRRPVPQAPRPCRGHSDSDRR
jgi:hypothetical protein